MQRRRRATVVLTAAIATIATLAAGTGPAEAAAVKADQPIAAAGAIVATDLPATWVASPPDVASERKALARAKKITTCGDYVRFTKANLATTKAASESFELGDQLISNRSYVYEEATRADKSMAAINGPTVGTCLAGVFQRTINAELAASKKTRTAIDDVTVTLAPIDFQAVGDDTVAFEGTVTIELTDGSTQELLVGLLAVRIDRVVTTYSLSTPPGTAAAVQAPFADAVSATLVRTARALQEQ